MFGLLLWLWLFGAAIAGAFISMGGTGSTVRDR
jgi:hypothetical protein